MEEEAKKSSIKWVVITGIILTAIIVLRFGRMIALDVGLLRMSRIHAQYLDEVDRIDISVFGEDPLMLRYESGVDTSNLYRNFSFEDNKELSAVYSDNFYPSLYLRDEFDDLDREEQLTYYSGKSEQLSSRLWEIRKAIDYPAESQFTHFQYKPNISVRTKVNLRLVTEKYTYSMGSDKDLRREDNPHNRDVIWE